MSAVDPSIRTRHGGRLRAETPEERQAAYYAKTPVPFPLVDENAFLLFKASDLIELEREHGDNYFAEVERAVLSGSGKVILDCLQLGLKLKESERVFTRMDFTPDDVTFELKAAAKPILNGMCQAIFGQSHDDLIAEAEAATQDAGGNS